MRRQPCFLTHHAARPSGSTSGCLHHCAQIYRIPGSNYIHARKHNLGLRKAIPHNRLLSQFPSRPHLASSSLIQQSKNDTNPAMDNDDMGNIIPVPWGRLKAWIEAQEKAEQSGHNPNPPKKSQLLALSQIVDFMDDPEPTPETIGKPDYVSELMRNAVLTQGKVAPPRFTDLAPIEVPIGGVFMQRWRTVCVLPHANNKEFPCLGYGLLEGKQFPLCKTKKISKQYAAKYAYLYMKAHSKGSTSSNGGASLASPARTPTPAGNNNDIKVNVGSNSSAKEQASSGSVSVSPSPMLPSPSSSVGDLTNGGTTNGEDMDFYDNPHLPSLLDQVKKETAYLKLGSPVFEIFPDPEHPALFAGRPVFKTGGGRVPKDLGYITGVLTRGLAKELIAEEILKYCKTDRNRRQGLMNTFNAPKEE